MMQKTIKDKECPRVAIIILNWNGWKDTMECLESLKDIKYPNYQLIVVDNGSTNESVACIRKAYQNVTLIETGKNLGYAGGNNAGICHALKHGSEHVLILNNDAKVEPDTLTAMVEVLEESNASVVGAFVVDNSGRKVMFARACYPAMLFFDNNQRYNPNKKWWPSDRVEGSAMLLHHDLLVERRQSLGYFLDDSLFLYCEELELGLWCRQNGGKSVVARDAIVYHKVAASSGGMRKPHQFYYITRNRLLIGRRYLRGPSMVLFFGSYSLWRIIRSIMYFSKLRIEVGFAILKGLRDGYAGKSGQLQ